MTDQPIIALAGASGDLGFRIARALRQRGADVRALVRPDADPHDTTRLEALGVRLARADVADVNAVAAACHGARCVVSALNGLRDVIMDRQGVLLDAAVQAGVPRFIPSDFSEDFTTTVSGDNRNLDLRREFMARADRSPLQVTSVLNGAFMDMLGAEMPIVQPRIRRVLYWHSATQTLDFTTKDDVAAYVAAAALDDTTPRVLRIAGDSLSARELAGVLSGATGQRYRTLRVGGLGSLSMMIRVAQTLAPQPRETFPAWQGMQYMRDMFSGRGALGSLDNDRYPELSWTRVRDYFARQGTGQR